MDMMKKVVMIVGLLLIVGYGYYFYNQKSTGSVKIQSKFANTSNDNLNQVLNCISDCEKSLLLSSSFNVGSSHLESHMKDNKDLCVDTCQNELGITLTKDQINRIQ